jgi:hypothetical protein
MKSDIYRNYQIYKLTGEADGISEVIHNLLFDINTYEYDKKPGWLFYGKSRDNILFNYDSIYKIFRFSLYNFKPKLVNIGLDNVQIYNFVESYAKITLNIKGDFELLDYLIFVRI